MSFKTPAKTNDPTSALLAAIFGDGPPSVMQEGVIIGGGFNADNGFALSNSYDDMYPNLGDIPSFGVCDSPTQFLELHSATLEADARPLCVFLAHVAKNPSNAHQGGGWRWHKWGRYIGTGEPNCEYLDDEDGFDDGVWVYSIRVVPS